MSRFQLPRSRYRSPRLLPPRRLRLAACLAAALAGAVLGTGCGPVIRDKPRSIPKSTAAAVPPLRYASTTIGTPAEAKPWITHVAFNDLDRDGRIDGLACDAAKNTVVWLRQSATGQFTETVLAADLGAPVHVAPVDLDGDGDTDLLVACMGRVLPTNDHIGSVVVLENLGENRFTPHTLIADTARVTDVQPGDFNGDGRLDLAVGKFGYYDGEVTWLENLGNWQFQEHALLGLSGTVNVCVADLSGGGRADIVALVSQEFEEIYLFENRGGGTFQSQVIYGSTNEDYGSSGISLCDLNRDGKPDVLYTNGDGFDYAEPGARPWHGVQWLENRGNRSFRFHRIGNLPGAYSPIGVDLNGDHATDVVCVSGFNNWSDPRAVSLVAFLNGGREQFTPVTLAQAPTHLVSVAGADVDGDGTPELLTGGFHAYPPWDRVSRLRLWRQEKAP